MKDVSAFARIFLATEAVDFRKQAHGLALIVENSFGVSDLSAKELFFFTNRRRNAVKLL